MFTFSTPWSYFCPCHIFKVVSTADSSILLIFFSFSNFVFSSRVKIPLRALTKRFFSASCPIISSKSSCKRFVKDSRKSKTPSIESPQIPFSSRYSSSSLLISSKMNVMSTPLSSSICSKSKRLSDNNYFDIFSQLFLVKTVFFWVTFQLENDEFQTIQLFCF